MAISKTSFKKGDNRPRKPKGAISRTTKESREFLEFIMFGQLDNMNDALNTLYNKDPSRYLDACAKLFTYVLPKKTDITSDDKPLTTQLPIIQIKTNGN